MICELCRGVFFLVRFGFVLFWSASGCLVSGGCALLVGFSFGDLVGVIRAVDAVTIYAKKLNFAIIVFGFLAVLRMVLKFYLSMLCWGLSIKTEFSTITKLLPMVV